MRRVFKMGAILALGMGVSLTANDSNSLIESGIASVDTNILQISAGVTDFKHLDKKRGVLNVTYGSTYASSTVGVGLINLKLSEPYKDISLANPVFMPTIDFSNERGFAVLSTGLGYLALDSVKTKIIHSTDPHIPSFVTKEIETQKAPYLSFNAIAGIQINESMLVASRLNYKAAVDRADMKDAYGASLEVFYDGWNLSLEHEKFDFRGVDDAENNSVRVGYSFSF